VRMSKIPLHNQSRLALHVDNGILPDAGEYRAEPSEDWRQGRTLFGGLSACLAVASAIKAFPTLPPLRSAQLTFIAPVTGVLVIKPRILRAGKSAIFVAADGTTETGTALQVTLVFGGARRSTHAYWALPMPHVEAPNALPDFFSESFSPRFTGHFEARIAGGAPPVSGAANPESSAKRWDLQDDRAPMARWEK
jgi:hypothetical protein